MTEPAGLYVHVPFCRSICPYCDFAVTTGGARRRAAFVTSLLGEIRLRAGTELRFDTIYFGGGTPTALTPDDLGRIVAAIREHLTLLPDARLFLEANPEDADALPAWRDLGVAFLSLGVQSFDDAELRFLGRHHSADDARRTIERALAAGIDTVSVDLIFGLPDQTASTLRRSLETAAALGPGHVSGYQLTVHPGTPFHRFREDGRLVEMGERGQGRHFATVHAVLADAGYDAYEVSNFARGPEHRSRHNLKYWHHVPYLGLGPSAHSFDGSRRSWNARELDDWTAALAADRLPVAGEEELDDDALALETLMLGLRTVDGVDLADFGRRYGIDLLAANRAVIGAWQARGVMRITDGRLRPTVRGLAVADGLAARLDLTR